MKKILKSEAVATFGGVVKLAKALGIRHSAVSNWKEFVPPLRAYQIRDLVNPTNQTDRTAPSKAPL